MERSPYDVAVERWCSERGITAYTPAQAAFMVGMSKDTITRWRRSGLVVPTLRAQFGNAVVHLYTPSDVVNLSNAASHSYSGKRTDLEG